MTNVTSKNELGNDYKYVPLRHEIGIVEFEF